VPALFVFCGELFMVAQGCSRSGYVVVVVDLVSVVVAGMPSTPPSPDVSL
jgi:hypothetical protein